MRSFAAAMLVALLLSMLVALAFAFDNQITSPYDGAVLIAGTTTTIYWMTNSTEPVTLVLGETPPDTPEVLNILFTIATNVPNTGGFDFEGEYKWDVPGDLHGDDYRIGISNATGFNFSPLFSILNGHNQITYPYAEAILVAGSTTTLSWAPSGTDPVTLVLEEGPPDTPEALEVVLTIASDIENSGEYRWIIPGDLQGDDYCIEISDIAGRSNSSFFSIMSEESLMSLDPFPGPTTTGGNPTKTVTFLPTTNMNTSVPTHTIVPATGGATNAVISTLALAIGPLLVFGCLALYKL